MFSLEYPESKSEDHWLEVDKLLPDKNNISELVHASRLLWKKWIILKMVFKIPKLERPKESKLNFNNFLKYTFDLINFFFFSYSASF